jgi:hypothetical protein
VQRVRRCGDRAHVEGPFPGRLPGSSHESPVAGVDGCCRRRAGSGQWVLTFPSRGASGSPRTARCSASSLASSWRRCTRSTPSVRLGRAPWAQRPERSRSCRGPRPICGSTRACTWSLSMAPGTRRVASCAGKGSLTCRRARSVPCSLAPSGASSGTFAGAACSGSTRTAPIRTSLAIPRRTSPSPARRHPPGRSGSVGSRPSSRMSWPTTSRCAPRSTGSPCTRPLVPGRFTPGGARRCCATYCARRSPRSGSFRAPTAWCASP